MDMSKEEAKMLFAEEMPVGWIWAGIVAVVGSLAAAVKMLFSMLLMGKEAQIKALEGERDSYKKMAEEAADKLEEITNDLLVRYGRKRITEIKPVAAEHHSPITKEQQEAADRETLKARLVAVDVALNSISTYGRPPEEPAAGAPDGEVPALHQVLDDIKVLAEQADHGIAKKAELAKELAAEQRVGVEGGTGT